jgi:protein-disulfide isomerase
MEQVPSTGLRSGWGVVRSSLDVVATIMVIAVAAAILYRVLVPQTIPVRAEVKGAAAPVRPPVPLPSEPLPLANAAIKGDRNARVAIIVYSDFQCPYCGVFARETWPALQKEFVDTGKVLFAFRHLPLDSIHPKARRVAEAAECARQQGKFWEFHDALFAQQKDLAGADMGQQALALGLAPKLFGACLSGQAADRVMADSRGAEELGINGTPTFFIGRLEPGGIVRVTDRLVGAQKLSAFDKAIAAAIGSKP